MAKERVRVVLVDDEKLLAWALGQVLSKAGYDVVVFNNPLLALDELRNRPAALVISDVVMPEMSGIDLVISIERDNLNCRIILLSGQANTLHLLSGAKAQGFDFEVFPKPIAPSELLRLVEARVVHA